MMHWWSWRELTRVEMTWSRRYRSWRTDRRRPTWDCINELVMRLVSRCTSQSSSTRLRCKWKRRRILNSVRPSWRWTDWSRGWRGWDMDVLSSQHSTICSESTTYESKRGILTTRVINYMYKFTFTAMLLITYCCRRWWWMTMRFVWSFEAYTVGFSASVIMCFAF